MSIQEQKHFSSVQCMTPEQAKKMSILLEKYIEYYESNWWTRWKNRKKIKNLDM